MTVSSAIADVATAMDVGWKQIPKPTTVDEQCDYAEANIKGDLWRAVAKVTSPQEYQSLHRELLEAAERYQDLFPLQKQVADSQTSPAPILSRYYDFAFAFDFQTQDKLTKLRQQYGENQQLSDALLALKSAQSQLRGIRIDAANSIAMDDRDEPNATLPGESETRVQQQQAQPQSQHAPRPPAPSPRRKPNGSVPSNVSSTERREQEVQKFVGQHGPENVVVIRVSNAAMLRPGVLVKQLTQRLGTRRFVASRPASEAIMAIQYSGTLEEVVQQINWGKVTSVDALTRSIAVDGSGIQGDAD